MRIDKWYKRQRNVKFRKLYNKNLFLFFLRRWLDLLPYLNFGSWPTTEFTETVLSIELCRAPFADHFSKIISEFDRQILVLQPKYRKSQTALANTANISMSTLTLASLFVDPVLKFFLLKWSAKRALQSSIHKQFSWTLFFLWLTTSEKVQL
jgi:hypothetical protein